MGRGSDPGSEPISRWRGERRANVKWDGKEKEKQERVTYMRALWSQELISGLIARTRTGKVVRICTFFFAIWHSVSIWYLDPRNGPIPAGALPPLDWFRNRIRSPQEPPEAGGPHLAPWSDLVLCRPYISITTPAIHTTGLLFINVKAHTLTTAPWRCVCVFFLFHGSSVCLLFPLFLLFLYVVVLFL